MLLIVIGIVTVLVIVLVIVFVIVIVIEIPIHKTDLTVELLCEILPVNPQR